MKIILAAVLCALLVEISECQTSNEYEFGPASMNDQRPAVQCGQCQSRPGRDGRRGLPGPKGDGVNSLTLDEKLRTVQGKCEDLEREMKDVKEYLMSTLVKNQDYLNNLVNSCGLGMKNRKIPDTAITESSQIEAYYAGHKGRLDHEDGWISDTYNLLQWIQIDLNTPTRILGVVTQGRGAHYQWVPSYKVLCGNTTSTLISLTENGSEKIFLANTDDSAKVLNIFSTAVVCRYVRINPQSWEGYIALRMELIAGECDLLNP